MNKIFATETETSVIDIAEEPPPPMICYDAEIYPKANMSPWWNNTSVFLGNDERIFPGPLRAYGSSAKECTGLLTDFKKKMQQTELHSRHLI